METRIFWQNNPHPEKIESRIDDYVYSRFKTPIIITLIIYSIIFIVGDFNNQNFGKHIAVTLFITLFVFLTLIFFYKNREKIKERAYYELKEELEKEKEKSFKKFYPNDYQIWMNLYEKWVVHEDTEKIVDNSYFFSLLSLYASLGSSDSLNNIFRKEFTEEHKNKLIALKEKYIGNE